ncbi:MAG: DHH family phosphoesterase [Candidatus Berkelbacteria bacterium]|nr:DHH family phosphoesterase [Candidatus Berkelbacteria bacterium]
MENSPKQQTIELINEAKNILVVSHKNPDGDSLGCLVALKLVLTALEKNVTIACADQPAKMFSFLTEINQLETKIDSSKNLIISLNLDNAEVEKLGYKKNTQENTMDIVISAKEGNFAEEDVKVKRSGAKFDLIIILDSPNLERLGSLAQPADLFYEIPVVNIDHHPANERFGKVNWVELIATSTAEILVSLIEALSKDKNLIDNEVATALLTGLIYDTSSFQNVNTTPKSLTVAAQLVAAGGRQQEIIKHLYKTKSLETLKLWGTILLNVKEDKIHHFLWSSVTKDDIEKAGADESALGGILDELLKSATDVDFALLLSEREGQVHGSLRSIAKGIDVSQIATIFGGGGHEAAAAFRIDGRLVDSENEILEKIRHFQNSGNVGVDMDNVVDKKDEIEEETPAEPKKSENFEIDADGPPPSVQEDIELGEKEVVGSSPLEMEESGIKDEDILGISNPDLSAQKPEELSPFEKSQEDEISDDKSHSDDLKEEDSFTETETKW